MPFLNIKNNCRSVVSILLVKLDLANKLETEFIMCLFFNLELWDDGLAANTVYVYYRSGLFLCRCQWSPSKRKLHWNVESKTPRRRKRPTLLIFAFNLLFVVLEAKKLTEPSWGFLFQLCSFLLKDSCALYDNKTFFTSWGFLFTTWACMKSELYRLTAPLRISKIIKCASSKCDIKTFKDKNGIIMHHPAASLFH